MLLHQPISNSPKDGQREPWMVKALHKSDYHLFDHGDDQILYDVNTGSFFQIDLVVLQILKVCEKQTLLNVLDMLRDQFSEKEIVSAFKELYLAGILTDVISEGTQPFTPPSRIEVTHLGLDITYDTLSLADGRKRIHTCYHSEYMSEEVALRAVDLLMKESGRVKECFVTFQGEEPLLNAPLVEKVITYGMTKASELGKEIFFEVSSNSNLLNEQIFAQLSKHNTNITVKLEDEDGDALPLFNDLGGPFSLSSSRISEYVSRNHSDINLIGDIDATKLNITDRLRRHLDRFPQTKKISLQFAPIPQGDPSAINTTELPAALRSLEDLARFVKRHALDRGSAWIGDFEDCIVQVLNRKVAYYHCGAGTRYLTVSPDGKLYVCPGLVKDDAFAVGDVFNGIDRCQQKAWLRSSHVEKFSACSDCWARYLCGGGCRLNSVMNSGEFDNPEVTSCTLIQRTYELAMATCLELASEDTELLHQRYSEEV
jgi:uncharacterized protein